MKKMWALFLMFWTAACVQAPPDAFSENINWGTPFVVSAQQVETVSLNKVYDSTHYMEKRWPLSPEKGLIKWVQKNLKTTSSPYRLIVVIHQAHVVRETLPATWYEPNEVKDTLIYRVEFLLKAGPKTKMSFTVGGKVFTQMPQKLSLADKEKEWAKMMTQMMENLNQQVALKLKNVV